MHKQIGKISHVSFGMGGYQEAMLGFSFTLQGEGWGCGDFWGFWGTKWSEHCKWSEHDRKEFLGGKCLSVYELMVAAKKQSLADLKNVPIEATFDSPIGKLISWRILTEVL